MKKWKNNINKGVASMPIEMQIPSVRFQWFATKLLFLWTTPHEYGCDVRDFVTKMMQIYFMTKPIQACPRAPHAPKSKYNTLIVVRACRSTMLNSAVVRSVRCNAWRCPQKWIGLMCGGGNSHSLRQLWSQVLKQARIQLEDTRAQPLTHTNT